MNGSSFLHVRVDQVVSKRKEPLSGAIGNAFASVLPFQNIPQMLDRSGDEIRFRSVPLMPGRFFTNSGSIRFHEEGVKTRLELRMNLSGLLAFVYAVHWLPALALWLLQSLWAALFDPELSGLMHHWLAPILLVWPFFLYLLLRRRIVQRMRAFMHNLVFHT